MGGWRRVAGGRRWWEEVEGGRGERWEAGGVSSEDRRRSLEIESIDRCRSNRFGHGMLTERNAKHNGCLSNMLPLKNVM